MKRFIRLTTLATVALGTSTMVIGGISDPDFDFCPGRVSTILGVSTDPVAESEVSSSIQVPADGGQVGVYFKNTGSDPITFVFDSSAGTGAWSVFGEGMATAFDGTLFGEDLARRSFNLDVPLTPRGALADFRDLGWGGTFAAGTDLIGCVEFANVDLNGKSKGTAHVDLSFTRGSETHVVRVNFHFRD